MGVKGLSPLIGNNPQLYRSHRLHDCRLVIDGNNILHELYSKHRLDYTTGGDYDEYYRVAYDFFDRLQQCNVEPYVVLDGIYPDGEYVMSIAFQRAKISFADTLAVSRGEAYQGSLPICTRKVFQSVMQDRNVAFIICDYEADRQVAALANELECPVLSGDSDFYIYDLKAGFIVSYMVDFDVKKSVVEAGALEYRYLATPIFFQEDFLNGFGEGFHLNRTTFRLFAALCGSDVIREVNMVALNRLLEERNAQSQSKFQCKLSFADQKQRDLASFLYGLRFVTRSEAVNAAVSHLEGEQQAVFREALHEVISGYGPELSLSLDLLGLNDVIVGDGIPNVPITLLSFTGEPLPSWFIRHFRSGHIISLLLQAATVRWVLLNTPVQQFNFENTYSASLHLRRVMYGVLLGCSAAKSSVGPKLSVMEIARCGMRLEKQHVFALRTLPNGSVIPPLDSLPTLAITDKRDFLFSVLFGRKGDAVTTLLNDVPDEWQLFTATLVHWLHYTCQDKKPLVLNQLVHLDSLLLMAIYYNMLQSHFCVVRGKLQESNENDLRRNFAMILFPTEVSRRRVCAEELSTFRKSQEFSRCNLPDLDVIHPFGQFQACLYAAEQFNRLLGCPVPDFRIVDFVSFPFVYNVCCYLNGHWSEHDHLLDKWLGPLTTPIRAFFQGLRSFIVSTVGEMLEHHNKRSGRAMSESSVSSLQ